MKAVIDIGTNTTLLLVGEVSNGRLKVVHEEQRIPRLGRGVDKGGYLSEKAMNRVIEVIKEYQSLLNKDYPEVNEIFITATSAVRDSSNKQSFVDKIKQETGLETEILTGQEEAKYTFWGARSVLDQQYRRHPNVILDIGGGSTEIAFGTENGLQDSYSFDMGCVRFTERYLTDDPPSDRQLARCKKAISELLKSHQFNFSNNSHLIGVAGTVTSLSYIDQDLETYSSKMLNNYKISVKRVSDHIQNIQSRPSGDLLAQYPTVMEGRADIFLAGLLILEQFMLEYNFDQLITSTGGIRHGAVVKEHNYK